jgi:hypothetical protein
VPEPRPAPPKGPDEAGLRLLGDLGSRLRHGDEPGD